MLHDVKLIADLALEVPANGGHTPTVVSNATYRKTGQCLSWNNDKVMQCQREQDYNNQNNNPGNCTRDTWSEMWSCRNGCLSKACGDAFSCYANCGGCVKQ